MATTTTGGRWAPDALARLSHPNIMHEDPTVVEQLLVDALAKVEQIEADLEAWRSWARNLR